MTLVPASFTVVWQNESGVTPKPPYIQLNLITKSVKIGSRDETRFISGDNFQLIGQRTGVLSINAYGASALEVLFTMKDKLQLQSTLILLREKEIAFLSDSDVRDLSLLLDTKIQKRAQFDLTLGYTVSIDEVVVPIESVEIENQLNGEQIAVELP
jgi:hypothetical protein